MMKAVPSRAIQDYYAALANLRGRGVVNETGLRHAFLRLLEDSLPDDWAVVPEYTLANGARPDATLFDENHVRRGYWEAKDRQRRRPRRGDPPQARPRLPARQHPL